MRQEFYIFGRQELKSIKVRDISLQNHKKTQYYIIKKHSRCYNIKNNNTHNHNVLCFYNLQELPCFMITCYTTLLIALFFPLKREDAVIEDYQDVPLENTNTLRSSTCMTTVRMNKHYWTPPDWIILHSRSCSTCMRLSLRSTCGILGRKRFGWWR